MARCCSSLLAAYGLHTQTRQVSPLVGFGHSLSPVTGPDSDLFQLLVPGLTSPQVYSLSLQRLTRKLLLLTGESIVVFASVRAHGLTVESAFTQ